MKILVTGATSMIGDYLLPMLVKAGHEVVATSRRAYPDSDCVRWVQVDLLTSDLWMEKVGKVDVWINFTSLKLLTDLLGEAAKVIKPGRIIAFSSTSRFTKINAKSAHDQAIAADLAEGEKILEERCQVEGIAWTIFRPTLIYLLGRDKNITLISNKIRQLHFFPLIGSGRGLRQPVHAEDLAMACLQALESEATLNKAYNLSGNEVLSYREMVVRLFEKQGMRPRFVRLPLLLFHLVIDTARLLPKYRYLTPDMADRMEKDMVFSHEDASRDFGFAPRDFQP